MTQLFRVDIRGAKPTNGHTGDPEVTIVASIEAADWSDARTKAARRYGIDVYDPAMLCTPDVLPTPKTRKRKDP